MNETLEFNSLRYGPVKVYQTNNWIVVYCRVDEQNWKHYDRDYDDDNKWSEKEKDWRGTIIGVRSLRLDFEVPEDVEIDKKYIEKLITDAYEADDLPWLHVERVEMPAEWLEMDNEALWSLENQLHKHKGDLEVELRQVKREHARVWALGDSKFDWAENL